MSMQNTAEGLRRLERLWLCNAMATGLVPSMFIENPHMDLLSHWPPPVLRYVSTFCMHIYFVLILNLILNSQLLGYIKNLRIL